MTFHHDLHFTNEWMIFVTILGKLFLRMKKQKHLLEFNDNKDEHLLPMDELHITHGKSLLNRSVMILKGSVKYS